MSELEKIKQPISEELVRFEKYFKNNLNTNVTLLNIVIKYLLSKKGKQMRPILVFLSAKLFGEPTQSTYNAAALIEIMHTATLIHDDIVDDSYERRGSFSINAIWKSKAAVLLGDYLLAKGLLLAISKREYDLLEIVSDAVKEMSEGELMQLKNSRKICMTQDEYFEIIRKKTATLISCCSACGAKSVGMPDEIVLKMRSFGKYLGIAFQIRDDLLDYQPHNISGKPIGNDIKEKKLTLPLIYAIEQSEFHDRKRLLKHMNNSDKLSFKIKEVRNFVAKYKGLEYANQKMQEYATLAKHELDQFSSGIIKDTLNQFIEYTILRNK
jgi:octaprenyl-diphosphate synthase